MFDDSPQRPSGAKDCDFARLHLHAYVEAELDPIRTNMVSGHLDGCVECRETAEDLKLERIWVMESIVRSPTLSQGFLPEVMQQVRAESRRAAWAGRRRAWVASLSAAALLVVAALIAARFAPGPESRLATAPPAASPQEGLVEHPVRPPVVPAPPAAWSPQPLPPPLAPLPNGRRRPEIERAAPEPGALVGRARAGVPSFSQVVSFATRLAPRNRPTVGPPEDDPCKPDLNSDGRMDWCDVAYSCQVLVRGAPPDTLQGEEPAANVPDCDEHCYRA